MRQIYFLLVLTLVYIIPFVLTISAYTTILHTLFRQFYKELQFKLKYIKAGSDETLKTIQRYYFKFEKYFGSNLLVMLGMVGWYGVLGYADGNPH